MKILLPLGIMFAAWTFCGLGNAIEKSSTGDKPTSNQAVKPAQDRNAVKKELVSLANDIATAAKDGDITFLAEITTDDFQLTDVDGKVQNKNKALADVKEEKGIKSFDISDENLVSLDETSAVLSYKLKVLGRNGRSAKAQTTDTFVKKDGKWLLKSEQQTLLK